MKTKRTRSSFRSMNSERRLESIFLFVTGKCNAKCAMCFYANDMAKKEKDFAKADAIRDELLAKGIVLEDTREGVKWKRA